MDRRKAKSEPYHKYAGQRAVEEHGLPTPFGKELDDDEASSRLALDTFKITFIKRCHRLTYLALSLSKMCV